MEKSYVISETLLNSTLGYLANQPYRQVAPLVQALSVLPEFTPVSSKEESQATSSTKDVTPALTVAQ